MAVTSMPEPIGGGHLPGPLLAGMTRKVRYALIVSIREVNSTTDIYAPVSIKIETSGGIMVWGRVGRRTPRAP